MSADVKGHCLDRQTYKCLNIFWSKFGVNGCCLICLSGSQTFFIEPSSKGRKDLKLSSLTKLFAAVWSPRVYLQFRWVSLPRFISQLSEGSRAKLRLQAAAINAGIEEETCRAVCSKSPPMSGWVLYLLATNDHDYRPESRHIRSQAAAEFGLMPNVDISTICYHRYSKLPILWASSTLERIAISLRIAGQLL